MERKRIGLAILIGGALLAVLFGVFGARLVEPGPGPLVVRSVPISGDARPRLILSTASAPLATAMVNARNNGRQEEVFATVEADMSVDSQNEAAASALVYWLRTRLGETSPATSLYGWRALNYLYEPTYGTGYVVTNVPATIWANCGGSFTCKSHMDKYIVPVALAADWAYALTNAGRRDAMYEYLCEWSNLLYADIMPGGTLDANDAKNASFGNIGALGVALMELSGSSDMGSCSLAMNANTAIQTIATFYETTVLSEARPEGGFWFEGPHYEDIGFNASAVFLAVADVAGYIDLETTAYANVMDYMVHEAIEPGDRWYQYADAALGEMDDYQQLHAYHTLFMWAGGNDPEYYRLWDMVRAGQETGGPWYVLGGEVAMYLGYFDPTVPTGTPAARSQFLRDNAAGTPAPVGGMLRARDNWGTTQMSFNLINRNVPAEHYHYDYSGIEITYGGKRFVVDHSSDYGTAAHGKALEQNHAVFYDTTNAKWGWMPPNDQAVNTGDNASAYGYYPALVDYQPVGVAVYSDNRYSHISPIWYPPTTVPTSAVVSGYIPKATITPAPVGRRLVLFSRQSGLPPVLAVYDRNSLGSNQDWRVLWNTAYDLTISGSGVITSPLKLEHPTGPTLYAFASDGLSMGHYTRAYPCPTGINCETAILQAEGTEVYYTQQSATNEPVFSTLWFPSPGGAPTIGLEAISGRNTYTITFPSYSGYTRYVQNQAQTSITIGDVATDAEAFLLNYNAAGAVIGGVFANYTALAYKGSTVTTGTADVASVEFGGTTASGYAADSPLASTPVASGPTWTPTATATATPTATATSTPTVTLTPSATPTATTTATPTATPTAAFTPQACPSVAVTVDGALTEWGAVTPVAVSGTPGAYSYSNDMDGTPSAVSGAFYCAHDTEYLYLAGVVTDGTVLTAPYGLEAGDAVTVAIDGYADGMQAPGYDDHSLTVGTTGRVYDYMIYSADVTASAAIASPGWRFELRVPAALVQDKDNLLTIGQQIGLTYTIINRDTAWAAGVTYDDIRVSHKYSVRLE